MALSRDDLLYALEVFPGIDAALDKGNRHVRFLVDRASLGKVNDIHKLIQHQQVFTQVKEGQLAAVTGTEFMNSDTRFALLRLHFSIPSCQVDPAGGDRATPVHRDK